MSAIFLSYRRDDSSGYAGRLFDNLAKSFGRERVFMDIETLEPGMDFVSGIDRAIESCGAVIAMIGPNWINARDGDGNPRLDNPHDFIRLEITTALNRGVRVIPALVHNASMPLEHELPEPLRPLCRLQAFEMSDNRWEFDVHRLAGVLDPLIAEPGQATAVSGDISSTKEPSAPYSSARLAGWLALAVAVVLVAAGGLWWFDRSTSPEQEVPQNEEAVVTSPGADTQGDTAVTTTAPPAVADLHNKPMLQPAPALPPATTASRTDVGTTVAPEPPIAATPAAPPAVQQAPIPVEPIHQAPPEPELATAVEPAPVAPPPGPLPSERRQREIAELIHAAEIDIAELRLTRPAGNNAYDRFRRVLELEPQNRAAIEGLVAITERYRGLVEDALDRRALSDAQRHLTSAKAVDPGADWLTPLQREIDQRRQVAASPPGKPEPAAGDAAQRARCLSDCERAHQSCRAGISPQTETDCLDDSKIVCEARYQSCMSDTSKLFMGRLSLESECAGVHVQCSKAAARECSSAAQTAEQRCDSQFDGCIVDCPGLR